ncbi:MAG: hypothetical protein JW727_00290 [Candidatus Aenigmarchaeota archaeon]|nr:hypothetical protein [Candidatus Aenigmarchaeota archaeon]
MEIARAVVIALGIVLFLAVILAVPYFGLFGQNSKNPEIESNASVSDIEGLLNQDSDLHLPEEEAPFEGSQEEVLEPAEETLPSYTPIVLPDIGSDVVLYEGSNATWNGIWIYLESIGECEGVPYVEFNIGAIGDDYEGDDGYLEYGGIDIYGDGIVWAKSLSYSDSGEPGIAILHIFPIVQLDASIGDNETLTLHEEVYIQNETSEKICGYEFYFESIEDGQAFMGIGSEKGLYEAGEVYALSGTGHKFKSEDGEFEYYATELKFRPEFMVRGSDGKAWVVIDAVCALVVS